MKMAMSEDPPFKPGDTVRVLSGAFQELTGVVEDAPQAYPRVQVAISIFGRTTPARLEPQQLEKVG
jgi:transcription termination/antitermination protein NusG